MPIRLDNECGQKCRSHQHALYINSAITKCNLKEFKAYTSLCFNATHINDEFGRNVLHIAASCGRLDIIEYLLEEKRYNIKAKDSESGWTALHRALFYGQIAAARLLIQHRHDLKARDHEGLSPFDIIVKDRPKYISFSPREPNEVYTWGDNANFNLGHSSQDRKIIPERVGMFKRVSGFVIQVVMCKFHTVFLTQIGQVYTCGHGHGGRLGHADQQTYVVPRLLEGLKKETCIQIAAAQDHTLFFMEKGTVYGCGSNEKHQLGFIDPVVDRTFIPKLINPNSFKGYHIKGVCAGRYHSVVYSSDAVFTFGLNGGQLGHSSGDKYQIYPRMISSLNDPDINITTVECSDSATVCLTTLGNVYICSRYTCRKIGFRWLDITKISISGGTLDHLCTSDLDLLKEKGGSELLVILLNNKGKVFLWRDKNPRFKRCNWTIRREIIIVDVHLNRNNMGLITEKGEGFIGTWLPVNKDNAKKKIQQSPSKSREVSAFPQVTLLDLLLKDEAEDVQIERISNIHRATNIVSDSKGRNFAVLQVLPNGCLAEIPYVRESTIMRDMKNLLQEADDTDVIHDVIIKVGNRSWTAHKYILASRSSKFYKLVLDTLSCEQSSIFDLSDLHPVIVEELLTFIYTDTCTALTIDSIFTIDGHNCDKNNDIGPQLECMTKRQRQKYFKRLEKESSKENDTKTALCMLKDAAEEFGIDRLVDRLNCVKCVNGVICSNGKPLAKPKLIFNRTELTELYNVCIRADDNTSIKCHKCILVARMEYFNSMLATGWIETSDASGLSLPVSGRILEILIHFIYTDEAPDMTDGLNVDLLCNILVMSDKLLIERLKDLCEVAIVNSLNFWNVVDLLRFSLIYNAHQLYLSCQQFICLNLPVFLESRLLNSLDDEDIDKLASYYRQSIVSMSKRIITPYSEGPSREYLSYLASHYNEDQQVVLCDVTPRKAKDKHFAKSESESAAQKAGNKRQRQISMCSDISIKSDDITDITDNMNNSADIINEDMFVEYDDDSSPHISSPRVLTSPHSPVSELTSPHSPVSELTTPHSPVSELTAPHSPVSELTSPHSPVSELTTPHSDVSDGLSFRDIMKAEEGHVRAPKLKHSNTSGKGKISWKDAKKLQKQKEIAEQQQRAAEKKKKKETPPIAVCPWASVNKVVKSFRDLMIEEEVAVPVKVRPASISSPEPDDIQHDFSSDISLSPHQDLTLSSWMASPATKPKQKATDPPAEKQTPNINPWQKIPVQQSPPALLDHSFTKILQDERHKKIVHDKIKKKPFKLVQIEEKAIQELSQHYQINNTFHEFITVERVLSQAASPLWIKEKPKSTSSIW